MKREEGERGITLVEQMAVLAICGVLMGIAGFSFASLRSQYEAESQVRKLHVDMMNARVRAVLRNKACFVTVTTNGYQITEDTNETGGTGPDDGDAALWPEPQKFKYQARWTGTVIMDMKGIISKADGPLLTNNSLAMRFDAEGVDPECNCILVGPTRINVGKWNGTKCAPR